MGLKLIEKRTRIIAGITLSLGVALIGVISHLRSSQLAPVLVGTSQVGSPKSSEVHTSIPSTQTLAVSSAPTALAASDSSAAGGPNKLSKNDKPDKTDKKEILAENPVAAKSLPVAGQCETMKFHHRDLPSHKDGEACLGHDNVLMVVDAADLNPASVCVRVNGVPVSHQLSKSKGGYEVLIGPGAGPRSEVSLSFCPKSRLCPEPCEISRTTAHEDFLDGMGLAESSAESAAEDPTESTQEEKQDQAEFEKVAHEFTQVARHEVFKDWMLTQREDRKCVASASRK